MLMFQPVLVLAAGSPRGSFLPFVPVSAPGHPLFYSMPLLEAPGPLQPRGTLPGSCMWTLPALPTGLPAPPGLCSCKLIRAWGALRSPFQELGVPCLPGGAESGAPPSSSMRLAFPATSHLLRLPVRPEGSWWGFPGFLPRGPGGPWEACWGSPYSSGMWSLGTPVPLPGACGPPIGSSRGGCSSARRQPSRGTHHSRGSRSSQSHSERGHSVLEATKCDLHPHPRPRASLPSPGHSGHSAISSTSRLLFWPLGILRFRASFVA